MGADARPDLDPGEPFESRASGCGNAAYHLLVISAAFDHAAPLDFFWKLRRQASWGAAKYSAESMQKSLRFTRDFLQATRFLFR
jgi:hypothetical protein